MELVTESSAPQEAEREPLKSPSLNLLADFRMSSRAIAGISFNSDTSNISTGRSVVPENFHPTLAVCRTFPQEKYV